jgi:hypothetical protein
MNVTLMNILQEEAATLIKNFILVQAKSIEDFASVMFASKQLCYFIAKMKEKRKGISIRIHVQKNNKWLGKK